VDGIKATSHFKFHNYDILNDQVSSRKADYLPPKPNLYGFLLFDGEPF
jgi:hypothetical protein